MNFEKCEGCRLNMNGCWMRNEAHNNYIQCPCITCLVKSMCMTKLKRCIPMVKFIVEYKLASTALIKLNFLPKEMDFLTKEFDELLKEQE